MLRCLRNRAGLRSVMSAFGGKRCSNDWRGPMLRSGELVFAIAIVNVPMTRLRLFARLRWRFLCWRLGHRSTIPSVLVIAV